VAGSITSRISVHLARHELVADQEVGLLVGARRAIAVAAEPRLDLVAHPFVDQRVLRERIGGLSALVARRFAQRRIEPRPGLQPREVGRGVVIRAHAHALAREREPRDRDERNEPERTDPHRQPLAHPHARLGSRSARRQGPLAGGEFR
jgi:hypothetical protein